LEIDANRMLKVSAEQKTSESMIIANKNGRPSDDDIAKIIARTDDWVREDIDCSQTISEDLTPEGFSSPVLS
jgi:hypothetical protein